MRGCRMHCLLGRRFSWVTVRVRGERRQVGPPWRDQWGRRVAPRASPRCVFPPLAPPTSPQHCERAFRSGWAKRAPNRKWRGHTNKSRPRGAAGGHSLGSHHGRSQVVYVRVRDRGGARLPGAHGGVRQGHGGEDQAGRISPLAAPLLLTVRGPDPERNRTSKRAHLVPVPTPGLAHHHGPRPGTRLWCHRISATDLGGPQPHLQPQSTTP